MISALVQQAKKSFQITPEGTVLTVVNDSFETSIPSGCAAEQLANYYNDELILIAGSLWEKMNNTERAALIIHEGLYAAERLLGSKDSRRTRHVVGRLFDANTSWVDPKAGIPNDALTCVGHGGALFFNAYKISADIWTLQFQILGKSQVMSRKTLLVFGTEFDFSQAIPNLGVRGTDEIGESSEVASNVQSVFESDDTLTLKVEWRELKDIQGRAVPGMQTPSYYLSWYSGSYPNLKTENIQINCGIELSR